MNLQYLPCKARGAAGFTLIEMVIVIVITGIIAAVMAIYFKPAIDSYFSTKRRANLTDVADSALRRMARDIRTAVPNSIRQTAGGSCTSNNSFELVPASGGGRYRLAADPNAGGLSAPIDGSTAVSIFDVLSLSPSALGVSPNDWVVIDNQNTDDVYKTSGSPDRAQIQSMSAATAYAAHQINLASSFPFPAGYFGGRFSIVQNSQNAVFYYCTQGGTLGQGDGTGTLYRFSNYGYNSASICPTPVATTQIVASNVQFCKFDYSSSDGATQNGFLWMQITLQQAGEAVTLSSGSHVDNVP